MPHYKLELGRYVSHDLQIRLDTSGGLIPAALFCKHDGERMSNTCPIPKLVPPNQILCLRENLPREFKITRRGQLLPLQVTKKTIDTAVAPQCALQNLKNLG